MGSIRITHFIPVGPVCFSLDDPSTNDKVLFVSSNKLPDQDTSISLKSMRSFGATCPELISFRRCQRLDSSEITHTDILVHTVKEKADLVSALFDSNLIDGWSTEDQRRRQSHGVRAQCPI